MRRPSTTLITCTGGRPEAFALLERWVADQTFTGSYEWLVVDDCEPRTPLTMGQRRIAAPTLWRPGICTLARNMAAALQEVQSKLVIILEDDEVYLEHYVELMVERLQHSPIVGEIPARYYNVHHRLYRTIENESHASLCQTAFQVGSVSRKLLSLCTENIHFLDLPLWRWARSQPATFLHSLVPDGQCVSIKGMPGRAGIGAGHRPSKSMFSEDPNLIQLNAWIGRDRAKLYAKFYGAVQ